MAPLLALLVPALLQLRLRQRPFEIASRSPQWHVKCVVSERYSPSASLYLFVLLMLCIVGEMHIFR